MSNLVPSLIARTNSLPYDILDLAKPSSFTGKTASILNTAASATTLVGETMYAKLQQCSVLTQQLWTATSALAQTTRILDVLNRELAKSELTPAEVERLQSKQLAERRAQAAQAGRVARLTAGLVRNFADVVGKAPMGTALLSGLTKLAEGGDPLVGLPALQAVLPALGTWLAEQARSANR